MSQIMMGAVLLAVLAAAIFVARGAAPLSPSRSHRLPAVLMMAAHLLAGARRAAVIALAVAGLVLPLGRAAAAHDYKSGDISIGHPWSRPTAPNAKTGAVYLSISNAGKAGDKLLSASSPAAETTSVHTTIKDGDIMRMRPVDAVEVAAGGSVKFEPGGYHIMLEGLKAPLKDGDHVPVTLTFEKAGKVEVESYVEKSPVGAMGGHQHMH